MALPYARFFPWATLLPDLCLSKAQFNVCFLQAVFLGSVPMWKESSAPLDSHRSVCLSLLRAPVIFENGMLNGTLSSLVFTILLKRYQTLK